MTFISQSMTKTITKEKKERQVKDDGLFSVQIVGNAGVFSITFFHLAWANVVCSDDD